MKTLQNYLNENQLTSNIVRSEVNKGREVYLILNNRTGKTALTSQPKIFGGSLVSGGIALICGDENGMGGDTYSTPIDTVSTIEELENNPFKVIDAEKTLIRLENGIEVSRKSGYANTTDAENAGGSWLNDCTVHAEIRKNTTVKIV